MKRIKRISSILLYIVFMLLNIVQASNAYSGFQATYSEQSFSKGIWGVSLCVGPYILIGIIMTIIFVAYLTGKRKAKVR